MSGATKDISEQSKMPEKPLTEEEIPIEVEEDQLIGTDTKVRPEYYECTDDYRPFDS